MFKMSKCMIVKLCTGNEFNNKVLIDLIFLFLNKTK